MKNKPARGSVKRDRLLEELGVVRLLDDGDPFVLIGPTYEERDDPNVHMRIAFVRDEERRICVGYASNQSGEWAVEETEVFTRRAYEYWQRRLKRIGDYVPEVKK